MPPPLQENTADLYRRINQSKNKHIPGETAAQEPHPYVHTCKYHTRFAGSISSSFSFFCSFLSLFVVFACQWPLKTCIHFLRWSLDHSWLGVDTRDRPLLPSLERRIHRPCRTRRRPMPGVISESRSSPSWTGLGELEVHRPV